MVDSGSNYNILKLHDKVLIAGLGLASAFTFPGLIWQNFFQKGPAPRVKQAFALSVSNSSLMASFAIHVIKDSSAAPEHVSSISLA